MNHQASTVDELDDVVEQFKDINRRLTYLAENSPTERTLAPIEAVSLTAAQEPVPEHETSAFDNNIEFDVKFRGYDRAQVEDYIRELTKDYNAICEKIAALERENEGLRKVLARLGLGSGADS